MSGVGDYRAVALGETQRAKLYDARLMIENGGDKAKDNAIDAAAWALRQNAEMNEKLGTILKSQFSRLYIADHDQEQVRTESEPVRRLKVIGNKIGSAFSSLTGKNPWEGRSDRNRAAHATVIAYHETRLIKELEERLSQGVALPLGLKTKMTSEEKARFHLTTEERQKIREGFSALLSDAYKAGKSLRSEDAQHYMAAAETLKNNLAEGIDARGQELARAMPAAVKNRLELDRLTPKMLQTEQEAFLKSATRNLGKAASAEIAAHLTPSTDQAQPTPFEKAWAAFKARATDTAFLAKTDAASNQLGKEGRVGKGALSSSEFYQTFLTQYFGIGPNWAQRTTERADENSILSPSVDVAEVAMRRAAIKKAALAEMTAGGRPSSTILDDVSRRFVINSHWFQINPDDVIWLKEQLSPTDGELAGHLEMARGKGALAGTSQPKQMLGEMAKAIEAVVNHADNWDADLGDAIADQLGEMMLPAMQLHNKQAIRNQETTQTGGVSQQFAQDLGRVLEGAHREAINLGDLDAFLKLLPDPRGSKLEYDNRSHPNHDLHPPAIARKMREAIEERLADYSSLSAEEWSAVRQELLDNCAELALPALKWLKATRERTQQAALDKAYEAQLKNMKPEVADSGPGKAEARDIQATIAAARKVPVEIGALMKGLHRNPDVNFSKQVSVQALNLLAHLQPGAKDIEAEFSKYARRYFDGEAVQVPTERHLSFVQRELNDIKGEKINTLHHIRFRTTDFHQTGLELAKASAARQVFDALVGYKIPTRDSGLFSGKNGTEEIKAANLRSYKFIEAMRHELETEAKKIADRHGSSASVEDHLDQLRGAALRPLMPLLHAYAEQMAADAGAQGQLNRTVAQTYARMMK